MLGNLWKHLSKHVEKKMTAINYHTMLCHCTLFYRFSCIIWNVFTRKHTFMTQRNILGNVVICFLVSCKLQQNRLQPMMNLLATPFLLIFYVSIEGYSYRREVFVIMLFSEFILVTRLLIQCYMNKMIEYNWIFLPFCL